jgi:hypothetical protein
MNENIAKAIEELEEIIKALHRSAANLDDTIEKIKLVGSTDSGEYLNRYIKIEYEYRKATKKYAGYAELDEMEADIWARLITDASVKTEES